VRAASQNIGGKKDFNLVWLSVHTVLNILADTGIIETGGSGNQ